MVTHRGSKRRIERVKHHFATRPIPQQVVDEAFEEFRCEGELSDDQRLAALVCGKAGYQNVPTDPDSLGAAILRVVARVAERRATGAEPVPLVREVLFDEALYGPDYVRRWARMALRVLVCRGGDVTDPMFANEHGLPEFGTVGMHVLGYPRRLAVPPYEEQGQRLFDRFDDIRRRLDMTPDDDFEPLAAAFDAFVERGELPADELMRDYVLAEYEIEMLHDHRAGRDVAEVMALLDRVATGTGEEREAAVAEVQMAVRAKSAG